MINSHLLYQLSYRGMRAILLISKKKSTLWLTSLQKILDDLHNGVGHAFDVALVQGCNADPASVERVDAKLGAQAPYLFSGQAGVENMPR